MGNYDSITYIIFFVEIKFFFADINNQHPAPTSNILKISPLFECILCFEGDEQITVKFSLTEGIFIKLYIVWNKKLSTH